MLANEFWARWNVTHYNECPTLTHTCLRVDSTSSAAGSVGNGQVHKHGPYMTFPLNFFSFYFRFIFKNLLLRNCYLPLFASIVILGGRNLQKAILQHNCMYQYIAKDCVANCAKFPPPLWYVSVCRPNISTITPTLLLCVYLRLLRNLRLRFFGTHLALMRFFYS
jgi:hypothetical protein